MKDKRRKYLIDLDGTIYRGNEPIQYAKEFIDYLYKNGRSFLMTTNCPENTPALLVEKLKKMGITVKEENIMTSGQVTINYLLKKTADPDVFLIGSEALKNEFLKSGIQLNGTHPQYVVVGFDRSFDYEKMKTAVQLIRKGAEFISTNLDTSIPDGNDIIPHTGALAAAIETATGVKPLNMGKPGSFMLDEALSRLGCGKDECCIIGDRLDTDILFGASNGVETFLVLTGITRKEELEKSDVQPNRVFANLKELIEYEKAGGMI